MSSVVKNFASIWSKLANIWKDLIKFGKGWFLKNCSRFWRIDNHIFTNVCESGEMHKCVNILDFENWINMVVNS